MSADSKKLHPVWLWLAAGIGVSILLLLLPPAPGASDPRPTLTYEQYDQVQVGMTEAEVEGVLGCPPGNYTTRPDNLPVDPGSIPLDHLAAAATIQDWAAETPDPPFWNGNGPNRRTAIAIRAWFSKEGRLMDKYRVTIVYTYRRPTVWQKIQMLLQEWLPGRRH